MDPYGIILLNGCFLPVYLRLAWRIVFFETVLEVDSAVSGYAGGKKKNPTSVLVNTEATGHAETVLNIILCCQLETHEGIIDQFYFISDQFKLDIAVKEEGF